MIIREPAHQPQVAKNGTFLQILHLRKIKKMLAIIILMVHWLYLLGPIPTDDVGGGGGDTDEDCKNCG